jgi:hypothetical protein
MPLQFKVTQQNQSLPPLDLPFESTEFDFETSKNFAQQKAMSPGKIRRKESDVRESRIELQDDTVSEYPVTEKESVSYIQKQLGNIVADEKRHHD